jgi:hypothetical protein
MGGPVGYIDIGSIKAGQEHEQPGASCSVEAGFIGLYLQGRTLCLRHCRRDEIGLDPVPTGALLAPTVNLQLRTIERNKRGGRHSRIGASISAAVAKAQARIHRDNCPTCL